MNRFEQRIGGFSKAYNRLKESTEKDNITELEIDGILKRFEFTFELAWKTLKDYLEYNGIEIYASNPREILKLSFQEGIIENGDMWIKMMLSRNEVSHIYDYDVSREIYNLIKNHYITLLGSLNNKFIEIKDKLV